MAHVQASLEGTFGPGALDPTPLPYDDDAKAALQLAVAEAAAVDHPGVTTEHELLGLIGVPGCAAARVMERIEVDAASLADDIRRRIA
jgi:ATP-dependent Clp protease ATP-binding subunit ClpA